MSLIWEGLKEPTGVQLKMTNQVENTTLFCKKSSQYFQHCLTLWGISEILLFIHYNEKLVIYCYQYINLKE